jgi:hypothetical protein
MEQRAANQMQALTMNANRLHQLERKPATSFRFRCFPIPHRSNLPQ